MSGSYKHFWQNRSHRNLWQHPIWFEFQKNIGRQAWLLEADGASALVVKHNLPLGLSWLEVPRGPLWKSEKDLNEILKKIKKLGKKENAIFVRLSPYNKFKISDLRFKTSKNDNHPETSLTIDLDQDEADILKQMKPKGRYNIKVARKHGVTISESSEIDEFYKILSTTANRDGFGIHPKAYYQQMLDSMPDNAQLLIAEYEGKVIAGGIFVYFDEWGIYYYGASESKYRNVMAPYLIQWKAIEEAKERGCKYYDFLGIAPENAKNHPWLGVTQFKKKFGGSVMHYPKAKEFILKPFWYWTYRLYKIIR